MALKPEFSLKNAFNAASGSKFMQDRSPQQPQPRLFFKHIEQDSYHFVASTLNSYKPAARWRNEEGQTGLMAAATAGANGSLTLLAKADPAMVDAQNDNGSTALMFAAYAGKASSANLLLQAGATVNHQNKKGHTALMSAAAHGHKNTIGVLLAAGADPRLTSEDGYTAADFATENDHTEIADLLKKMSGELDVQDTRAANIKEAAVEITSAEPTAATEEQKQEAYKKSGSALESLHSRLSKAGLIG